MGAMSMLTDIDKRKEAEDALTNIEIARKKEIHHRIKNNLQVILSLLDLQAEKFNNSSTSPTGSRNHLASFRFQNTFRLNV